MTFMLKRLCQGLWMTVTASCEANMFSKHWKKFTNRKNELWKTRIEISFSPLQVCPSVLLFVFAVLLRTSFHILTGFICFTQFSGSSPFNLVSQFLWQIKHKATRTSFLRRTLCLTKYCLTSKSVIPTREILPCESSGDVLWKTGIEPAPKEDQYDRRL